MEDNTTDNENNLFIDMNDVVYNQLESITEIEESLNDFDIKHLPFKDQREIDQDDSDISTLNEETNNSQTVHNPFGEERSKENQFILLTSEEERSKENNHKSP